MKSLSVRLALLYGLVTTATLAVLFVAGYYLLNQHLIHGLDVLNEAEFEQIKASLGPDYASLSREKIEERIRRTTEVASAGAHRWPNRPHRAKLGDQQRTTRGRVC